MGHTEKINKYLQGDGFNTTKFSPKIIKYMKTQAVSFCGVGEGWLTLIIELDKQLTELYPNYQIQNIKEKLGGLRFYTLGVGEDGKQMINLLQDKVTSICIKCGNSGDLRFNVGGVKPLCDKHYQEFVRCFYEIK